MKTTEEILEEIATKLENPDLSDELREKLIFIFQLESGALE